MRRGVINVLGIVVLVVIAVALGAYFWFFMMHRAARVLRPEPRVLVLSVTQYFNYTTLTIEVSWSQPFNVTVMPTNVTGYIVCVLGCSGSGKEVTFSCPHTVCKFTVNAINSTGVVLRVCGSSGCYVEEAS